MGNSFSAIAEGERFADREATIAAIPRFPLSPPPRIPKIYERMDPKWRPQSVPPPSPPPARVALERRFAASQQQLAVDEINAARRTAVLANSLVELEEQLSPRMAAAVRDWLPF